MVTTNGTTINGPNGRMFHVNNSYTVSPAVGTLAYIYAAAGSSCSTVSCHSDGTAIVTGVPRTSGTAQVSWGGTALGCTSCHGNPPAYADGSPKKNRHQGSHAVYGCQVCHYSVTTNGTSITAPAQHKNGTYDLAAGPAVFFNYSTRYLACSNVSCHSDGTGIATDKPRSTAAVAWTGTTLGCQGCHGGFNTGPDYANGAPKANSHQKHCWDNNYGCQTCHYSVTSNGYAITTAAKHKNGVYDLAAPPASKGFTYVYAKTGGTCSVLYCHSNGTTIATGGVVTALAYWGGPALGCDSCHGNPPAYPNGSPKANGHQGAHAVYACDSCHYQYAWSHANGRYTVGGAPATSFNYAANYPVTSASCSLIYCHSDGTSLAPGVALSSPTYNWGQTVVFNCTSCHAMPPLYADRSPKVNMHQRHSATGCQVCHYPVTTNGASIANPGRHANGEYDVASDGTLERAFVYEPRWGGGSCSNIACHQAANKPVNCNWTLQAYEPGSMAPLNGSVVDTATPIQVYFVESMDAASINASTFKLYGGETQVAGTVTYDETTRLATFTPVALAYRTTYRATITTGIKNYMGIPLNRDYEWSFSTGNSPQFGPVFTQHFDGVFSQTTGSGWGPVWLGYNGSPISGTNGDYVMAKELWVAQDGSLLTPLISIPGYKFAELRFSYNLKYSNPTIADVDISPDGLTWKNVWSKAGTVASSGQSAVEYVYLNITDLLTTDQVKWSEVKVRFRYYNVQNPANQGWWAIDNIDLYIDPN